MEAALISQAQKDASRFGLNLEVRPFARMGPSLLHPQARQAIRASAQALGLAYMALPSGAGHDAQVMAAVTPSGMTFVPSMEGASHSPREFTR